MRVLATIGFSFSAGVFLAALLPWNGWQLYGTACVLLLALVWLLAARRSTCFRRGLLISVLWSSAAARYRPLPPRSATGRRRQSGAVGSP